MKIAPAPDQPFDIIDRAVGIASCLILGGITNEPFCISECDVRRGDPVALIIRNDVYPAIFINSDAGIPANRKLDQVVFLSL